MPKATGTGADVRKAMLADEVDPEEQPRDIAPTPMAPSYVAEPAAPVAAPATPDMAALIQMLAGAIAQSGTMNAETIKSALADQAQMARHPIPETYLSGGYPGHSVFSHPSGDLVHPRTELRCPMYIGAYTEKGEVIPAFEIYGDVCTEKERVLLNALEPGAFSVERNDGLTRMVRVVAQNDDLGKPIRLVIAVPQTWLSKAEQAQMPSQIRLLKQLTETAA